MNKKIAVFDKFNELVESREIIDEYVTVGEDKIVCEEGDYIVTNDGEEFLIANRKVTLDMIYGKLLEIEKRLDRQ